MEGWVKVSIFLCIFGVLKEFRPSEPFVTKYLSNPPMEFTVEEVDSYIYPVSIYATMVLLIFIFLITDFLRYKPIIILQGISGIIVFIMLILCRKLILIQIVEVFYGLFMACDVAYYTYTYAKVDKSHYQEVTGHTRAAYLIGRALSGIVSQILISSNKFSYYVLNFFSLGGLIVATIWACFLPKVEKSIYFHRKKFGSKRLNNVEEENVNEPNLDGQINRNILSTGWKFLWEDYIAAFKNPYVVKWIFWWALATCGYYQVLSYVQVLWENVVKDNSEKNELDSNLNGAVEAVYTIMSAIVSFGCGKVNLNWEKIGEMTLFVCSVCIGIVLYIMSQAETIWVAYVTYIIYTIIYHAMITIANSEVAKCLNPDSHGLIFGITTFIALVLQSILTTIVNATLALSGRTQFVIYASYFTVLGILFMLKSILTFIRTRNCTAE